ncbi:hypothetical protein Csa_021421 [Cucumis sativus]|uniref:Uncharacterized protein n=1 Tax=Cucumis sativus TaxID=3659 RepID=A0A0A0KS89_CUCSA|nr:hypothetical protein Csa_021421 [Cucumis sativus]
MERREEEGVQVELMKGRLYIRFVVKFLGGNLRVPTKVLKGGQSQRGVKVFWIGDYCEDEEEEEDHRQKAKEGFKSK